MEELGVLSKIIADSETFLDIPVSAQDMCFHLHCLADEEGCVRKYSEKNQS